MKPFFTITLTVLLIIISGTASAQTFDYNRDFRKITELSNDTIDSLNYKKLLKRFMSNDSSLTDVEVLNMMIGFTETAEYEPYETSLMELDMHHLYVKGDYQGTVDFADAILATYPFSIVALTESIQAHGQLIGHKEEAAVLDWQRMKLFGAMKYSGDGSNTRPYFALSPDDGKYFIREFLGKPVGKASAAHDTHGNTMAIFSTKDTDKKPINKYFIVAHLPDIMLRELTDMEKKEMEKGSVGKKK